MTIKKVDVYVKSDLYQTIETARAINALIDRIVISEGVPNNNDGREDGTIYFQIQ